MALHPPLPAGPADPAGAAQEEHLLLLRIASASGLLLDIHSFGFVSVYFWSRNVRRQGGRLEDSLLPRRLWRASWGDAGKRDPRCCFYHPIGQPLGPARVEAQLEGLLQRLALAGPAGFLVSGVMLPTVPDLARKKKNRYGKKWPYTLRFLPGLPTRRERHRRSTYCCCGSPPLLD